MRFHIHDDYIDALTQRYKPGEFVWRDKHGWALEREDGKFWTNVIRALIHTDIVNTFFKKYNTPMEEFADKAAQHIADQIDEEIIKDINSGKFFE